MDRDKIKESFVETEKGVFVPRSIIIRKNCKVVKSQRYKDGCVLLRRVEYEYLLKMANEAESARFK